MNYRIESDFPLESNWLPAKAFTTCYERQSAAIAVAIEGIDDPAEQEVRVICVETGETVWCSTSADFE